MLQEIYQIPRSQNFDDAFLQASYVDYYIYFLIQADILNAWIRSAPRPIEQIGWFLRH